MTIKLTWTIWDFVFAFVTFLINKNKSKIVMQIFKFFKLRFSALFFITILPPGSGSAWRLNRIQVPDPHYHVCGYAALLSRKVPARVVWTNKIYEQLLLQIKFYVLLIVDREGHWAFKNSQNGCFYVIHIQLEALCLTINKQDSSNKLSDEMLNTYVTWNY